ncbi:hypothetical protein [Ruegeria sp. HKCCA6837]|uniref:hypothetical protein n=1 Tax=Ruegeria sp. HKCCA6837 TaxID=2682989 RepID=UPI0014893391|nr:hypothetical protein [Ruegeria sp. HKCCA6837]
MSPAFGAKNGRWAVTTGLAILAFVVVTFAVTDPANQGTVVGDAFFLLAYLLAISLAVIWIPVIGIILTAFGAFVEIAARQGK